MNTRSSKAKGRRLQNWVRDKLRYAFITCWNKLPTLEEDDIKSQTMGMTGEDIILSPAARKIIPYSFECKNVEKLNIWSTLDQAETNAPDNVTPIAIIKRNHSKVYVVIEFDAWINSIGGVSEPIQGSSRGARCGEDDRESNNRTRKERKRRS